MADKPADKKAPPTEPEGDMYELLPHKDILELKEELRLLKAKPTEKNLQISIVELSTKLDRLIEIFEEAQEQITSDGGEGLSWEDKMRPLTEKMDKILEQNGEIARGILGLSDMINEVKESSEKSRSSSPGSSGDYIEPFEGPPEPSPPPHLPPLGQGFPQPLGGPSRLPPLGPPGGPLPPPPVRKR